MNRNYSCRVCGFQPSSDKRKMMFGHMVIKHPEFNIKYGKHVKGKSRDYTCGYCGLSMGSIANAVGHIRKNHSDQMDSKMNSKGEVKTVECENKNTNPKDGISASVVIAAIEKMIIENRELKARIKLFEEDNEARIKNALNEIKDLQREFEICRIEKRRAEDALRKRIYEDQRPLALKIEQGYIQQNIDSH